MSPMGELKINFQTKKQEAKTKFTYNFGGVSKYETRKGVAQKIGR
jgi:hypothetical protein